MVRLRCWVFSKHMWFFFILQLLAHPASEDLSSRITTQSFTYPAGIESTSNLYNGYTSSKLMQSQKTSYSVQEARSDPPAYTATDTSYARYTPMEHIHVGHTTNEQAICNSAQNLGSNARAELDNTNRCGHDRVFVDQEAPPSYESVVMNYS